MTRQLRQGKGKTGLILANGGWVTYQHVLCLSRSPRSDGLPYPDANPLPKYVTDVFIPKIAEQAEGNATIEVSLRPMIEVEWMLTLDCRRTPSNMTETTSHSGATSSAAFETAQDSSPTTPTNTPSGSSQAGKPSKSTERAS